MIAAVPSETLAALMGQPLTANGATPAAGGFNVLLDMLMAIEPQAAKAVQGQDAGAEFIEMAAGFSGNEMTGQGNGEPQAAVEQTVAIAAAQPETTSWMQMQQPCAQPQAENKTQTVAAQPEADSKIKNSVTVAAGETDLLESIMPAAEQPSPAAPIPASNPIAAIVEKFAAKTAAPASEGDVVVITQTEPKASAPAAASQTTTIDPGDLETLKTPTQVVVEPKQKQENAPAVRYINTAAAVVTITPALVAQIATAKPAADDNIPAQPIKTKPSNGKSATASVVNTATVIDFELEQPKTATVIEAIENAVQPDSVNSTPTPATPTGPESKPKAAEISIEDVALVAMPAQNVNTVTMQTVAAEVELAATAQANSKQSKPAAKTTANTTAQVSYSADQEIGVAGPSTKTEYTWNLSELIHRFDQQVAATMGESEQPAATKPAEVKTVDPETDTIPVAPKQTTATWEAKPVEAADASRGAHLAEQVRQASEWLAEKAEGTIRVGDHGTEANMKLYPPDMGGLRVKLSVTNDLTVQAQFIADRPEAALAIKQNIEQLQQAFVRQGMTLESVQVSVAPAASSSNGNGSAGQQQNSQQQNSSSTRREPETMSQQQNRQFENRNQQERRQRQQA